MCFSASADNSLREYSFSNEFFSSLPKEIGKEMNSNILNYTSQEISVSWPMEESVLVGYRVLK